MLNKINPGVRFVWKGNEFSLMSNVAIKKLISLFNRSGAIDWFGYILKKHFIFHAYVCKVAYLQAYLFNAIQPSKPLCPSLKYIFFFLLHLIEHLKAVVCDKSLLFITSLILATTWTTTTILHLTQHNKMQTISFNAWYYSLEFLIMIDSKTANGISRK